MYLQVMETFEISIKTALTDWKLCIQYKIQVKKHIRASKIKTFTKSNIMQNLRITNFIRV